ncbi:SNF2-related protein [Margalitia sp. FSL K6-0131]|uniref:SNF2-related protein n=1 Tax=Margalitia sp. FSL K6-0131 TaxID=2954604 RepID=UPI0030FADEF8
MSKKLTTLQSIYKTTLSTLMKSEDEWKKYLSFAAQIHKYPFDQAVLVYAQNPNVSMLAPLSIWKQFNRIIKHNSKAIEVIKFENGQSKVDYLFDISQTTGNVLQKPQWEIQDQEKDFIIKAISQNPNHSLEEAIDDLVKNIAKIHFLNAEDYFEQTFANELNDAEYKMQVNSLYNLVVASSQYAVREKCGLVAASNLDMSYLKNIDSIAKVNLLGNLVTNSTKAVMNEIALIKKNFILERNMDNDRQFSLPRERRTTLPEHSNKQQSATRSTPGDLREKGNGVSTGNESTSVLGISNDRDTHGNDAPSRQGSEREDYQSNEGLRENESATENGGHISNNPTQESIEGTGRGDRPQGIRVSTQINNDEIEEKELVSSDETSSFVISKEENGQLELFNDWDSIGESNEEQDTENITGNEESSVTITQKDIDDVLIHGTGFENGKLRVVNLFATNPTDSEAATFLKKEYGIGGWGNSSLFVNCDSKGLFITKDTAKKQITWTNAAKRIRQLISLKQYLSPSERVELESYNEQENKADNNQDSNIVPTETTNGQETIVQNYRYNESDDLYPSGEKTKFKNNIEAIRLLKQLELNKQIATPEQQIVLAKYVGWGGLANVFSTENEKWEKEQLELKTLLTDKEYREAMESTITAYYTDPNIVKKIYGALNKFGFENGNILDPAMGTGNFFSVLPESMNQSNLTGVELDSITGRLAKQLYPNANILVQGYETTNFKDNQFDVVIGNIPFNNIQVSDKRYDEHKFLIHDYFIAKSLDVVKPGGIIAVITSKGTMDKKSTKIREYMAARSELLGAIRLPNNAFKSIAGTEVTTDILFLKKREEMININDLSIRPNWIDISPMPNNHIEINNYFIENPHMMLGEIEFDGYYDGSRQYTCVAHEGQDLLKAIDEAMENINGSFTAKVVNTNEEEKTEDTHTDVLDAPIGTKNFTYVVQNNKLYYCENKKLIPQNINKTTAKRIMGLCEIRTALKDVIDIQTSPYEESELKKRQEILNKKYDEFVSKYGYINDPVNQRAFFEDEQLPLLLSIEDEQSDKTFKKAAIFYKATIRPQVVKDYAETAQEALEMSLNHNLQVDIPYMSKLCKSDPETIIKELGNLIYLNPEKYTGDITKGWETSDEYLTGNVHDKLAYARLMATKHPNLFQRNVEALEDVQPPKLLPGDIHFRIGSPWIPKEYYQEFMYDLLGTSTFNKTSAYGIKLEYSTFTNTWKVEGKDRESNSVKVNSVYGTARRNGYQIFEDCLNLQDSTVRDPKQYLDNNGKTQVKYVVNPKETMIARSKQQEIQEAFQNWLFQDPVRSEHLLQIYNDNFNNIRPRTYNGEHLTFPEMNEEMQLRSHQKNVVARILSTGRALMAHEVGAGKTAAMIAAAMKLKQIGAVKKPMFVVMNHTIDQWAKEILRFYPGANVLVTTKKDFEKKNRQRFVSKIATGDYDAVVIGHSQFEKIPISKERQENNLRKEIQTLSYEIQQAKKEQGNNWSVKQLVIFQKSLENRLKKLINEEKKDDVINFEELGVDCLFVDEAHAYKNLHTVTKLQNVAGIGTSSSQRATDMKMKCEYIQEINQGRGVIFATGTPITNSMSELFVMQRFLQPDSLQRAGLEFFDNWAGTFGEVVSSLEMTPEGSGYRMKSRFSKFHNLPELMNMFNQVADIQTAEMLKLPVPKLKGDKAQIIVSECSDFQKEKMDEFVERSELIRDGAVDPSIDNMLKLTHEAKLMAIDPRLIDENAPVNEHSKLNMCVKNVYKIWEETKDKKSTQMIFCDSGTPKPNKFNVYDEIKNQLMKKGIPSEEIAFIHDAKTDVQRDKLFSKVRKGEVRILLGSTNKVGTGTNVQDKLIAGHHIDCPWRPADLTQRDGRILRQGNTNEEVAIYRYVTKGTFDGYLWQIQEQKLRYISQVMTGKNISRSCDDTDETVLTAAEVKAIATDNPLLLEKMTLDNEITRLRLVKNRWSNEKAQMEENLNKTFPTRIKEYQKSISKYENDLTTALQSKEDSFQIQIAGEMYTDQKEAGEALKAVVNSKTIDEKPLIIGEYKSLRVFARRNVFNEMLVGLQGESSLEVRLLKDEKGNIQRLESVVQEYPKKIRELETNIENTKIQMEDIKSELEKPFVYEEQLTSLIKKQTELNLKLEFENEIKQYDESKKEEPSLSSPSKNNAYELER